MALPEVTNKFGEFGGGQDMSGGVMPTAAGGAGTSLSADSGVLPDANMNAGPNPEWGGGNSEKAIQTNDITGNGVLSMAAAGGNGGSYGADGRGPGGFDRATNTGYFDAGGAVGGEAPGNTAADPMALVKQTLAYGRQKMGLPQSFYGSEGASDQDAAAQDGSMEQQEPEQQSFEDGGGVLPEEQPQQEQPQQGGQMPDPRKAMAYLTGAGAVAPEVANAMEAQVDPQGAMDPGQRKMMAITKAQSPDQRFGLMQHYRSRFNAQSAFAKAALTGSQQKPASLPAAAQAATQAFQNVPNGQSISLVPAQGGFQIKQGGAPQQQPQQQSFEDGGGVLPEEGNQSDDDTGANADTSGYFAGEQNDQNEQRLNQSVISPQQLRSILERGYDWLMEKGSDALKTLTGAGAQQAPAPEAGGTPDGIGPDEGEAPPDAVAEPQEPTPQAQTPMPKPRPGSAPQKSFISPSLPGQREPGEREANPKSMQTSPDVLKRAQALFPGSSDAAQRTAYITHEQDKEREQKGKLDVANATWGNKREIEKDKDVNRNLRAANSIDERRYVAQLRASTQMTNAQITESRKVFSTLETNNPGLTKDPKKLLELAGPQLKYLGIDPAAAVRAYAAASQGGEQPSVQPTKQLSAQDQQAMQWAKANPTDPRAAKIRQRLGAQ